MYYFHIILKSSWSLFITIIIVIVVVVVIIAVIIIIAIIFFRIKKYELGMNYI